MVIMSKISVSEREFLRRIKLATVKVNEIVFVITKDLVCLFLTICTLAMSEFWNRAYIRIPINNLSIRASESINATGDVYCKAPHSRARRVGTFAKRVEFDRRSVITKSRHARRSDIAALARPIARAGDRCTDVPCVGGRACDCSMHQRDYRHNTGFERAAIGTV